MWYNCEEEYIMKKAIKVGEIIDVFDPRPLETTKNIDDFYVKTSEARGENAVNKLVYLLNNSSIQNQKILFMGHNGCGKSTELYKAALNLQTNYFVIQYSVGKYVDYLTTTYIDIILSVLNNIAEKILYSGIKINTDVLTSILNYWNQENTINIINEENIGVNSGVEISTNLLNTIHLSIETFFKSSNTVKSESTIKIEHSIPQFINLVNQLLNDVSLKLSKFNQKLLVIIDDLDKITMEQAAEIFIKHSKHITSLKANIIYTFPISLFYSPEFRTVSYDFNNIILLSMIKVKNKDGTNFPLGRETIRQIIIKRADEALFEEGVVDFVIEKSGGCIRTVFRILREAALQTELKYFDSKIDEKEKIVSMEDVIRSYRSYKSEMERVIRKEQVDVLIDIHNNKTPFIDENNLMVMNLLMCLAVIEYNGDRWCDLNPAVEDFLIEKNLIKKHSVANNNNKNPKELLYI